MGEPEADTFANALKDYLDRAQRNTAPATFVQVKRVLDGKAGSPCAA